ncbi:MAG: hypothetical protein C0596_09365 [Marinilabiliales bacterium]|nr:MAG: hypothetical protein C0596_09365 [Marinilabiliales bacterium]
MGLFSCGGNTTESTESTDKNKTDSTENNIDTPNEEVSNSVIIGNQEWMDKNLDVDVFRNGDPIPEAKNDKEWMEADENGQPAWCYFDDNPDNNEDHGKLYNWYAVNDPRGLAPEGWFIPSEDDWSELIEFLGGETEALSKLKSTSGWNKDGNGTNKSGFNGVPSGYRTPLGASQYFSEYAYYWTSTEYEELNSNAIDINLYYPAYAYVMIEYADKGYGYSVRCIKE